MSKRATIEAHAVSADRQAAETLVSVEGLLYAAIFALALGLRLAGMGRWPLTDDEARLALDAWGFARGLPVQLRGHSPLLFHLDSLLLFFSQGSDVLVRTTSLAFGSLAVLLPAGLRSRLGRIGALVAALLLALSPSFIHASRLGTGQVVVATCALALLVLLAGEWSMSATARAACVGSVAAVGLLAAPSAYTVVALLAGYILFLALWSRVRRTDLTEALRSGWQRNVLDEGAWRPAVLAAGAVFLIFGLGLLFNPSGLQMALDQLGQWLGGFVASDGRPWYLYLLLLPIYEGLPLALGLAGLWMTRSRSDGFALLLRCSSVFGIVFSLVPGQRGTSNLLLGVLPFCLAAGWAGEALWSWLNEVRGSGYLWTLVAVTLLAAAAAFLQLVNYLSFAQPNYVFRLAALAVFVLAGYALVWTLVGPAVPLRAAGLSLCLLLLLGTVHAGVRLNDTGARDPSEPLFATVNSPDLVRFSREAALLSSRIQGDSRVMPWFVEADLQVPLGWYLRQFEQVEYVRNMPIEPGLRALVFSDRVPGPAGYVGLRFGLSLDRGSLPSTLQDWLRWWVRPSSPVPLLADRQIVLWVPQ